ncbi:MAG: acyltransferase [Lachnospiraceae bacterium]|nr:acyltransferase [Lachnospiraceae bacterium]
MNTLDNEFHRQHFDSIQALRGITALFIILEHIRFLNCGAFGVDIFFCISGFMIMFSTHTNTQYFVRKRLIRILPLYVLMTLGTFLLLTVFPQMFEQSHANPIFLIKSLLFIPFDMGGGAIQPLMRIGWTINCEIFFYLLFFIALKINHNYRGLICSILLLGTVLSANLLPAPPLFLAFYGSPVMLEFTFGILSYYIARKLYQLRQEQKLSSACLPLCIAGIFICFLGLLITKPDINILGFRRPLLWGLPALLIVLCTFTAGLYLPKIPLPLVKLGNISFSLYLVHYYPVMLLDRAVFDFSVCTPHALLGTVISIAISVVLALVSHYIFENKLPLWLRQKLLRPKTLHDL